MTISSTSQVSRAERRAQAKLQRELGRMVGQHFVGQPFDPFDRLFMGLDDKTAYAYTDIDYAGVNTMLRRDGKARSVEQVLTLPIRQAPFKLEPGVGDTGEYDLVDAVLGKRLKTIIAQGTSAFTYSRAFWEVTWKRDDKGRPVYDEIEFRPATSCEPGFDAITGRPRGFRQRIIPVGGYFPHSITSKEMPGYKTIDKQRSFVYVHGAYREPVKGVSDMDVAFFSYTAKIKILYLWATFLENQALPKVIVYGDDIEDAADHVDMLAELKNSGLLGLPRSDPGAKAFDVLESSGLGAQQFLDAVNYFDNQMTASVLAGFTNLADSGTASRTGSYALSNDQREFYEASRQGSADELAEAIMTDLFGPMLLVNFGPDFVMPKLTIGPISTAALQRAVSVLNSVITAPAVNVPQEFINQLVSATAAFLDLDPEKLDQAVEKFSTDAATKSDLALQLQKAQVKKAEQDAQPPEPVPAALQAAQGAPGFPPNVRQLPIGKQAANAAQVKELARMVDLAYDLAVA